MEPTRKNKKNKKNEKTKKQKKKECTTLASGLGVVQSAKQNTMMNKFCTCIL